MKCFICQSGYKPRVMQLSKETPLDVSDAIWLCEGHYKVIGYIRPRSRWKKIIELVRRESDKRRMVKPVKART